MAHNELLAKYDHIVVRWHPLVAYSRLHYVAPVASVAIMALVLIGGSLSTARGSEDAARLIRPAPRLLRYQQLIKAYGRENGLAVDSVRVSPLAREILAIPESARLRNCALSGGSGGNFATVTCDGHDLKDGSLLGLFWLALAVSVGGCAWWGKGQVRDGWMLPRWGAYLWYTPIYAVTIGLIFAGPYVLVDRYQAHAAATYSVKPTGWALAQPGVLLFVLLTLQISAVVIATLQEYASRPRPSAEQMPGGGFAVVGASYPIVSAAVHGPLWLGVTTVVGLVGLCLLAAAARGADAGGRAGVQFGALSRGLIPAWGLFLVGLGLRRAFGSVPILTPTIAFACLSACAAYVATSRSRELLIEGRAGAAQGSARGFDVADEAGRSKAVAPGP